MKGKKSFLKQFKKLKKYSEFVMSDKNFRSVYAENIAMALFTFPKFQRNYSKNYVKVQRHFAKNS